MNMKSKNILLESEYEHLFSFDNAKEKTDFNAQHISFKILSEVEKVCEERKLKKKDLALKIGTSKSYITQLFRGNKSINTQAMAKFEEALDMTFQIEAVLNERKTEFIGEKFSLGDLTNTRPSEHCGTWYFCYNKRPQQPDILNNLKTENKEKQAA